MRIFNRIPELCQPIASTCTVSCVNSLGTIAILSFNRRVIICHNKHYFKIFKKVTCIGMCLCLYTKCIIGVILVMFNFAGVGGHSFDRKSLDCICDRMATYIYIVIVSVAFVWIQVVVVGLSYLFIYWKVIRSQNILSRSPFIYYYVGSYAPII